jgi:hypothetical protein
MGFERISQKQNARVRRGGKYQIAKFLNKTLKVLKTLRVCKTFPLSKHFL